MLCLSFLFNVRVFHKSLNVAGTGPRATVKKRYPFTVGRWENLSLAMRFAGRPHQPCRAGEPEPNLFGLGHSRTTVSSRSVGP